jgi:hypothetical protein
MREEESMYRVCEYVFFLEKKIIQSGGKVVRVGLNIYKKKAGVYEPLI